MGFFKAIWTGVKWVGKTIGKVFVKAAENTADDSKDSGTNDTITALSNALITKISDKEGKAAALSPQVLIIGGVLLVVLILVMTSNRRR